MSWYLNFFTKAMAFGPTVILNMSPEASVVVEYPIRETGHIKYYLGPKIVEDEDNYDQWDVSCQYFQELMIQLKLAILRSKF